MSLSLMDLERFPLREWGFRLVQDYPRVSGGVN